MTVVIKSGEASLRGVPLMRAAQLPPCSPPGNLMNSVVMSMRFAGSWMVWRPPLRTSYSSQP